MRCFASAVTCADYRDDRGCSKRNIWESSGEQLRSWGARERMTDDSEWMHAGDSLAARATCDRSGQRILKALPPVSVSRSKTKRTEGAAAMKNQATQYLALDVHQATSVASV